MAPYGDLSAHAVRWFFNTKFLLVRRGFSINGPLRELICPCGALVFHYRVPHVRPKGAVGKYGALRAVSSRPTEAMPCRGHG